MVFFIQLFGLVMIFLGVVILYDPQKVFAPIRASRDTTGLQILAVSTRVILGALLVAYAPESKFPAVVVVLGGITLVAALLLSLMHGGTFIRLMSWALELTHSFGRVAAVFVVAFGAFLVYVFI